MEFRRNSSRSSIRASPATIFTIKRKNRYDQLESTIDQGDHDDIFDGSSLDPSRHLVEHNHYMTLINQSDDENKNAFENMNFFSSVSQSIPSPIDPCMSYSRGKRTPPPIPKRQQSQSISSNDNKTLKSVHSSIDVVSSSSETNHSKNSYRCSHRNSPVPILPAPPRRDSRKGRKRPPCLDVAGGVGGQIFPTTEPKGLSSSLTFEALSTSEPLNIRTSASHQFNHTKLHFNEADDSDDGSSLLIPQLTSHMTIKDELILTRERDEDDYSDFEIIDLVLKNSDDDQYESIKGSTNNLAEFENDPEFDRPKTNQLSRCVASSMHLCFSNILRPDSTDSDDSRTTPPDINLNCEIEPFQTEKLLKSSECESDSDSIFNAIVKLPRGRKHRIRGRTWNQVQLSLTCGTLQIFSEDARLIETINFYTDVQLSNIYIQRINNKVCYFIKLFKVTYKAKRAWGMNIRGYSEYLSNESNFSNYVSRLRPIIKIGTRDYSTVHLLAKSISNVLAVTDKISEETNLLTPSPYCRVIIETFDEITFLIDSTGSILSSLIETSLRILTFGTDKLVIAFNDEKTNLNYFEEVDLLQTKKKNRITPQNIRLHSVIKENTGEYDKQRIIKFNPINGAKIEIIRFNTQMNPDTKLPLTLKTEYTIFGNSISITSSLHLNEIETIKNLVIRFPILPSWKEAIKESTFNSITSGTYTLEDRSLLWKLNEISNLEVKQEFMSVKFCPLKLTISQMQYCQLEFELDDTRLSGTVLRAISLKTKNQETEKFVNYRSYYTLRVGIQFIP